MALINFIDLYSPDLYSFKMLNFIISIWFFDTITVLSWGNSLATFYYLRTFKIKRRFSLDPSARKTKSSYLLESVQSREMNHVCTSTIPDKFGEFGPQTLANLIALAPHLNNIIFNLY
jgi:hypothetical protein